MQRRQRGSAARAQTRAEASARGQQQRVAAAVMSLLEPMLPALADSDGKATVCRALAEVGLPDKPTITITPKPIAESLIAAVDAEADRSQLRLTPTPTAEFETTVDRISIAMPFPGASPRELEEQICVRIEEAIHDLDGIKEIRSTASDGMGQVIVEALTGYPTQRLTNEIKTRVDAITTFPTDAERPVVTELIYRHMLGIVQLAGELDEWELKELGETLRDDLARQPWISVVDLVSPRRYEVSVNVSELDLRRHNLSSRFYPVPR